MIVLSGRGEVFCRGRWCEDGRVAFLTELIADARAAPSIAKEAEISPC
jgi:hypothetical protein